MTENYAPVAESLATDPMILFQVVTENRRSTGLALNVSWSCVQFIPPSHQYLQVSSVCVLPRDQEQCSPNHVVVGVPPIHQQIF